MSGAWRYDGQQPSKWPPRYPDHGTKFTRHAVELGCGHEAVFTDAAPKVGAQAWCYRCRDYARVAEDGA